MRLGKLPARARAGLRPGPRRTFEAVAAEENRDEEQRAEATLKMGVCFYEARNYGKCFQVMRDVIEKFPVSPQVNEAYYYIGLGHFQLGHYSRAIDALEKVGTALRPAKTDKSEKVEAGKRLFVKIEDADLAALEPGQTVKVRCETDAGRRGDGRVLLRRPQRAASCWARSSPRSASRSRATACWKSAATTRCKVTYVDEHTADRQFNQPRAQEDRRRRQRRRRRSPTAPSPRRCKASCSAGGSTSR